VRSDHGAEHKPDLILLDMILPKISGPELLARLKKDAATADIPVVVLSSLTEKNRQKVVEAGAENYVESILDAAAGSEGATEDTGERDLPDQSQTRDRI
jgi:CheY-like chemotaxis protein